MKNKKGFTLIELLAVIVVLAIIALIATPIVMNTIKNAKKGAAERSADNYVKAVEQKVAESRIDGTKISDGIYNIQPDGNLCPASGCGENDKNKITIDMSGNKPTSGRIKIKNNAVLSDDIDMKIGDYTIYYNTDKGQDKYYASQIKSYELNFSLTNLEYAQAYSIEYASPNGDDMYFASGTPTTIKSNEPLRILLKSTEGYKVSKESINVTGAKYTLSGDSLNLYIRLSKITGNVTITANGVARKICDYDSIDSTYFCNTDNGSVKFDLLEDGDTTTLTESTGRIAQTGQISLIQHNYNGATVRWSNDRINHKNDDISKQAVKAKEELENKTSSWTKIKEIGTISLPTAEQIAAASGQVFNDNKISSSNLAEFLQATSETRSYWTSNPVISSTNRAWAVSSSGLVDISVTWSSYAGVRPVITISKSDVGN
jgi:prepilin-type N-terminal cleavage/methylation domain-containing protein